MDELQIGMYAGGISAMETILERIKIGVSTERLQKELETAIENHKMRLKNSGDFKAILILETIATMNKEADD